MVQSTSINMAANSLQNLNLGFQNIDELHIDIVSLPAYPTYNPAYVNWFLDSFTYTDGILPSARTEDSMINIQAADLLANDTDPNGDVLTLVGVSATSASGVNVLISLDGSVMFDAASSAILNALGVGETMVDTFTYTISDGNGGTSTATASLTIRGTNDGPVAANDGAVVSATAPTTVDLLANDTDADTNDVLSLDSVAITSGLGTVSIVGNQLVYDPGTAYATSTTPQIVTVQYTMSDNHGASSTATAELVVGAAGASVVTAGADVFQFTLGDGNDVIHDFDNGLDQIRIFAFGGVSFGTLSITAAANPANVLIQYSANDSIELAGLTVADIDASDFQFI